MGNTYTQQGRNVEKEHTDEKERVWESQSHSRVRMWEAHTHIWQDDTGQEYRKCIHTAE